MNSPESQVWQNRLVREQIAKELLLYAPEVVPKLTEPHHYLCFWIFRKAFFHAVELVVFRHLYPEWVYINKVTGSRFRFANTLAFAGSVTIGYFYRDQVADLRDLWRHVEVLSIKTQLVDDSQDFSLALGVLWRQINDPCAFTRMTRIWVDIHGSRKPELNLESLLQSITHVFVRLDVPTRARVGILPRLRHVYLENCLLISSTIILPIEHVFISQTQIDLPDDFYDCLVRTKARVLEILATNLEFPANMSMPSVQRLALDETCSVEGVGRFFPNVYELHLHEPASIAFLGLFNKHPIRTLEVINRRRSTYCMLPCAILDPIFLHCDHLTAIDVRLGLLRDYHFHRIISRYRHLKHLNFAHNRLRSLCCIAPSLRYLDVSHNPVSGAAILKCPKIKKLVINCEAVRRLRRLTAPGWLEVEYSEDGWDQWSQLPNPAWARRTFMAVRAGLWIGEPWSAEM